MDEKLKPLQGADPSPAVRFPGNADKKLKGLNLNGHLLGEELSAVYDSPDIRIHATGVRFLDDFIDGLVSGEIYLCLGPTGSAKTLLAVQIAVTYSQMLRKAWVENGRKSLLGKVFYITTEDGAKSIRLRMLSFGAVVNRDKLTGKSKAPLTTKETMSDADRALADDPRFRSAFSETDRIRMMKQRFKDNLRVIDIRDGDIIPSGVHPIIYVQQQIARMLLDDENSYCALIVLDHCETLIGGMTGLREKGAGKLEFIERLPLNIKNHLATHFDCPVWVVHQASGVANEKGIHARLDHTEGKGSKHWGTDFYACFSISKVDREANLCRLQLTKHEGGLLMPDKTLELLGRIGTLRECEKSPHSHFLRGRSCSD